VIHPEAYFPRPMPGEVALSHLVRAQISCGTSNPQALFRALNPSSPTRPIGRPISGQFGRAFIPPLAHCCGMDVEDYICMHTTLPFMRSLSRHSNPNDRPSDSLGIYGSRYAQHPGTMRYCEECRVDQVRRFGFAYWLTRHQLPGVFWCTKHKSVLRTTGDTEFHLPPTDTSFSSEEPVDLDGLKSRFVSNYLVAVEDLLGRPQPLDIYKLGTYIEHRIAALGLRHSVNYHDEMRERLEERAPEDWRYLMAQQLNTSPDLLPLMARPTQGRYVAVSLPILASLVMYKDEIRRVFGGDGLERQPLEPLHFRSIGARTVSSKKFSFDLNLHGKYKTRYSRAVQLPGR
jgi:hypothetical protein